MFYLRLLYFMLRKVLSDNKFLSFLFFSFPFFFFPVFIRFAIRHLQALWNELGMFSCSQWYSKYNVVKGLKWDRKCLILEIMIKIMCRPLWSSALWGNRSLSTFAISYLVIIHCRGFNLVSVACSNYIFLKNISILYRYSSLLA